MTVGDIPLGTDCPQCYGVGYRGAGNQRPGIVAMLAASLVTVDLAAPSAAAAHVHKPLPSLPPCPRCMGSGVVIDAESLVEMTDALRKSLDWLEERGTDSRVKDYVEAYYQNAVDLLDSGAPVCLRAEQVRCVVNLFMALRFDIERRLANTEVPAL